MTQEDEKLLLKDLCARLPYVVMVQTPVLNDVIKLDCNVINDYFYKTEIDVYPKPYLRPMSSMTEEERKEYGEFCINDIINKRLFMIPTIKGFDWLNENHFDYRELIEKGLALEAPDGMYNTKQ